MYYYKIYGVNIKSDYKLEEVIEIPATETVQVEICANRSEEICIIQKELEERQKDWFLYLFEKEFSRVNIKEQGLFQMEQGKKIIYQLVEGYNPLMVNQAILCYALPVLLMQRGKLMLHGSGVLWKDKAIIISGVSGSGKSTLTAEFLENDGIFMADDTVAITLEEDIFYAEPAYPQQKICSNAVNERTKAKGELILLPQEASGAKYALRLKEGFCKEKKELSAIIIIKAAEIEQVKIKEIQGSEKIKYLIDNLYKRRVYLENGMPVEIFKQCVEVANKVKIYELTRPKEGMTVREQVKKIKEELGKE